MEQRIVDLLLEIIAKSDRIDIIQILISIAPSIVAIIAIVFSYIQSRNLIVLQKENDNRADNRRLLIQKSDEIIHDLYTLDDTLQCMFQETSYLVTQTEETDELDRIINKREEGKEKYRMQYIKCKSGINTYYFNLSGFNSPQLCCAI
jgi:hypothetical protein